MPLLVITCRQHHVWLSTVSSSDRMNHVRTGSRGRRRTREATTGDAYFAYAHCRLPVFRSQSRGSCRDNFYPPTISSASRGRTLYHIEGTRSGRYLDRDI